jgi:4-hydroxythreonine-4-phosphate dehydrogenase
MDPESTLKPHRNARARIALTVGDPAGIGPELVQALLDDDALARAVQLVVVGPEDLKPEGVGSWQGTDSPDSTIHLWCSTPGSGRVTMGRAQADCGRTALAALRRGAGMAQAGEVEALVTAPVCKEALHLAGEEVEGQTELLGRWAGASQCEMVAMAGNLRVMLLSRHMPLAAALKEVRRATIVERLRLFDSTLRAEGIPAPRLAVAGLNPHAGEGGLFGSEEIDEIAPAVAEACALGLSVQGPISPDRVFLEGSRGHWDGVLALYHDQGFIPLKLLSEGSGVTLLAGLPYRRLSPVHGTAFDIAGEGRADPTNLRVAVVMAARGGLGSRPSQEEGPASAQEEVDCESLPST